MGIHALEVANDRGKEADEYFRRFFERMPERVKKKAVALYQSGMNREADRIYYEWAWSVSENYSAVPSFWKFRSWCRDG